MDNVFPVSLELIGGLFNQREDASIVRQRACVSVCVCPPTVQQPVYEPVCLLFYQQKKPALCYF